MSFAPKAPVSELLQQSSVDAYGYIVVEGVTFWPRAAARALDLVVHFAIAALTGILLAILFVVSSGGHPNAVLVAKIGHAGLGGLPSLCSGASPTRLSVKVSMEAHWVNCRSAWWSCKRMEHRAG